MEDHECLKRRLFRLLVHRQADLLLNRPQRVVVMLFRRRLGLETLLDLVSMLSQGTQRRGNPPRLRLRRGSGF